MSVTVVKEEVCYPHRSLETEGIACYVGPHGEAPWSAGGSGSKGKTWTRKSLYHGFQGKELAAG